MKAAMPVCIRNSSNHTNNDNDNNNNNNVNGKKRNTNEKNSLEETYTMQKTTQDVFAPLTLHFLGGGAQDAAAAGKQKREPVRAAAATATLARQGGGSSSGSSSVASLSPHRTTATGAQGRDSRRLACRCLRNNHHNDNHDHNARKNHSRTSRRCSSPFICSSTTDGGLTCRQEEEGEDAESSLSFSAYLRCRAAAAAASGTTHPQPPPQPQEARGREEEGTPKGPQVFLTPCAVGVNTLFCIPDAATPHRGTAWAEVTAALRDALQRPVTLKLHEHSAGGTYMVEAMAAAATTTEAEAEATMRRGGCPDTPVTTTLAVFKPKEEEIGQERNPHHNTESDRTDYFAPGSGSAREVLAYLLDHGHRAGVPPTIEVARVVEDAARPHPGQRQQVVGSLQRFTPGCRESCDVLPGGFSPTEVHAIALFDIRTLNGDRHGGNILVQQQQQPEAAAGGSRAAPHLIPIDHSYICPCGYADPDYEWLEWPQAKLPFSAETLAYIAGLDAAKDAALVREVLSLRRCRSRPLPPSHTPSEGEEERTEGEEGQPQEDEDDEEECHGEDAEAAAEVVACATRLLQIAALEFHLNCCEIGRLCRRPTIASTSVLEELLAECRDSTSWRVRMDLFERRTRAVLAGQTRK